MQKRYAKLLVLFCNS